MGERNIAPLRLRLIFPQELPLVLRAADLELAARFGDFAGSVLTRSSPNQICLARALDVTAELKQECTHAEGHDGLCE